MLLHTFPRLPSRNQLLAALPREDYTQLLPGMKEVELIPGQVLFEITDDVTHIYFPFDGMLSLLALTMEGGIIEIAMVGNEGVGGLPAILGMRRTPYRVTVQIGGRAAVVRADVLRAAFERSSRLREVLLRYTYTLLTQISQSAVCNHYHRVEQRLSRWLLVARDRVQSNHFQLTQEIISHMLGIPRTNVTMRASELQRKGLIRYSRGSITIVDPHGLEENACECYRMVREEISGFLAA